MKIILITKCLSIIVLMLFSINFVIANEGSLIIGNGPEKENNFFQGIFYWFLDLFESEANDFDFVESIDSPKLEALQVIEEQPKEGKPKRIINETCEDCKTFDTDWTTQECFAEDFICPADTKGKSLGCMPVFPNRDYAKFCRDPCLSWIIRTCSFAGYNS